MHCSFLHCLYSVCIHGAPLSAYVTCCIDCVHASAHHYCHYCVPAGPACLLLCFYAAYCALSATAFTCIWAFSCCMVSACCPGYRCIVCFWAYILHFVSSVHYLLLCLRDALFATAFALYFLWAFTISGCLVDWWRTRHDSVILGRCSSSFVFGWFLLVYAPEFVCLYAYMHVCIHIYFFLHILYIVQSVPSPRSLRALINLSGQASAQEPHLEALPSSAAFLLSSSLPPVPPKLVAKVQALHFVDMKEFLQDNVMLGKRLDALGFSAFLGPTWGTSSRPSMREVPAILSWISCFIIYITILADTHPRLVHSRLAYMSLIIMEARRNGGDGWRSYGTVFRQNAANNPDADWSRLDASLHASTFLAQRSELNGVFCSLCFGTDHSRRDCAMRFFSTSPSNPSWQHRPSPSSRVPICKKWNWGNCSGAGCNYRHVCFTCPSGSHRAIDCPATRPGSQFKRAKSATNPSLSSNQPAGQQ